MGIKKRNIEKIREKKSCDRKGFLEEHKSKFNMDSEDNTDHDNYADFRKYDLDPDKSLEFEDVVIIRRDEKTFCSRDY